MLGKRARGLGFLIPLVLVAIAMQTGSAFGDSVVNVTTGNMNGWTLGLFDGNGNPASSAPYTNGTAAIVAGPGIPPGGAGSVNLALPSGAGDGGAAVATEQFDNTRLSSITSLSYSTYDTVNNGQQFPYLAISINTGSIDNTGDGNALANTVDTIFFEPPYQTASAGNPALADQGATEVNQWQTWNANNLLVGGFWDNDGVGNPGTGVEPLSALPGKAFPDATIQNGRLCRSVGGIALQVGFASPGRCLQRQRGQLQH